MATPTPMTHRDRGRLGARKRWGEPRVIRLDQLDSATSGVIRAILRAQEHATATVKAASTGENVEAAKEARRASDERPAAE